MLDSGPVIRGPGGHPVIRSVTVPKYDVVLHFRDAYLEYVPNYRIDNEPLIVRSLRISSG